MLRLITTPDDSMKLKKDFIESVQRKKEKEAAMSKSMIRAAKGEIPADLVLKNGSVLNVFSEEIVPRSEERRVGKECAA